MNKILLGLLTSLVALALFFAFRYSQTFTPEVILKQWFDMNAPTRFAFVSDQETKKLAVVDIEAGKQVGLLDLQIPAKILAIEKTTGTLAYSAGGQVVILHNLSSHQERKITFSHTIKKIFFSSYSELVAIGKENVSVFPLTEKTIQGQEHFSICVDCASSPHQIEIVSAVFSPLDQALWLLDSHSPALQRIELKTGKNWRFPLPPNWQNFSPLAMSPDGQFLLFGGQQEGDFFATVWNIAEEKVSKTFPLSAPLLQPYIDQTSKHLVMINQDGKGVIVQSANLESRSIDVEMTVSGYASVWLDRKLLVIGNQLKLFQLSDFKLLDEKKMENSVHALFIHGNSKVAIFGANATATLYIYRSSKQILQKVVLNGIRYPSLILMGASNTICH